MSVSQFHGWAMPLERLGEVRLAPAESIRRPGLISIISAQLPAKTMLMVPHCRWLTGGLAYKIFSHWDRLLRRGGRVKGGRKGCQNKSSLFRICFKLATIVWKHYVIRINIIFNNISMNKN